jgi:hypothetical protein
MLYNVSLRPPWLAAVGSTGLGAGFIWVKGESEAAPAPVVIAVQHMQHAKMAKAPVWVLWW